CNRISRVSLRSLLRCHMRKSRACILFFALAVVLTRNGNVRGETPAELKKLNEAKLETALKATKDVEDQIKAGRRLVGDDIYWTWNKRVRDAEIALSEKK